MTSPRPDDTIPPAPTNRVGEDIMGSTHRLSEAEWLDLQHKSTLRYGECECAACEWQRSEDSRKKYNARQENTR